jgi:hypothetical protein
MLLIVSGTVLLVITVFLFRWGVPKAGNASPVPTKWGLATAFPILLMSTGIIGLLLVLKGIFSG